MSLSLQLGLVYLISEVLLTVTRRSRSRTGTKQDRANLIGDAEEVGGVYVFAAVLFFKFGGLSTC